MTSDLCSLSGPPQSGASAASAGPARAVPGSGSLGRQSGAFRWFACLQIVVSFQKNSPHVG